MMLFTHKVVSECLSSRFKPTSAQAFAVIPTLIWKTIIANSIATITDKFNSHNHATHLRIGTVHHGHRRLFYRNRRPEAKVRTRPMKVVVLDTDMLYLGSAESDHFTATPSPCRASQ
jgi:hypothetical protein